MAFFNSQETQAALGMLIVIVLVAMLALLIGRHEKRRMIRDHKEVLS